MTGYTCVEIEITVRVRKPDGAVQGAAVRRRIQHFGYAGETLRKQIASGLVLEATQRLQESVIGTNASDA